MEYKTIQQTNDKLHNVEIGGKQYTPVCERIRAFRMMYPDGGIVTEVIHFDENMILIKATITDQEGHILATGHASETKGSTAINKLSFVENCETSAVGRALGALSIGADKVNKIPTKITSEEVRELDVRLTDNQKLWIYRRFSVGSLEELELNQYKAIMQTLDNRKERQSA